MKKALCLLLTAVCLWGLCALGEMEAPEAAASVFTFIPPEEGIPTAPYLFQAVDEAGQPVEGVMFQLCDDKSCQAAITGEDGMAQLSPAPYPYEIHVLRVPDGYVKPEEAFLWEENGGTLALTLQREP